MLQDESHKIALVDGAGTSGDRHPDFCKHLTSSTTQVRQALEAVHAQLQDADQDQSLNDTAQIVLAEVLNNVVEHAYGSEPGHPITLTLLFRPDGLWCEIFDEGLPMPNGIPPNGVMPNVDLGTPSDLPEGGFGWAMVRELTEEIRYQRNESVNHLSFLIQSQQP